MTDQTSPPGNEPARKAPWWRSKVAIWVFVTAVGVSGVLFSGIGASISSSLQAWWEELTDVDAGSAAPFRIEVIADGGSPEQTYALDDAILSGDDRVNAQLVAGERPAEAVPVDLRRDAWQLRAVGDDPLVMLNIRAVEVTQDDVEDGVLIQYGLGGQGGGDEPPETYSLALDLVSGDLLTSDGVAFFDAETFTLRNDRSVILNLGTRAPDAAEYSWILRFEVETENGEIETYYAGPSGELYAQKADMLATDVFRVTGRADAYDLSYIADGQGDPVLQAPAIGGASGAPADSGSPAELEGRWCTRSSTECFSVSDLLISFPEAKLESGSTTDYGATEYQFCLVEGDCSMAASMFVRYFPAGVAWDCSTMGGSPDFPCDPDFTAAHDIAEPRLVRMLNHQQGTTYVDSEPMYRVEP